MAKFTAIETSKIDSEIKAIAKAADNLNNRVQRVALSIVGHFAKNKDYPTAERWMNELVKSLGKGMRGNSLLKWGEVSGFFVYNKESKMLVAKRNADIPNALIKAHATMWYDAEPEKEYVPLDFKAQILRLVKAADKDIKELGSKSKVDTAALEELRKLAA